MPLQEHNYWLTTTDFPKTEPRPLPARVDVAVIGAGFTGLSAAHTLAQRGAKVAVLESETIGWLEFRNGGMVLTGLKLGVNQLISMYGRELTRRMSIPRRAARTVQRQAVVLAVRGNVVQDFGLGELREIDNENLKSRGGPASI